MRTDKKYTKLYVKFPKKLKISYTKMHCNLVIEIT